MGWGTITGGGTDGLYTLSLDYGSATRDAWLAGIDSWTAKANAEIAAAEAKITAAHERTELARAKLSDLIQLLADGGGTDGTASVMAQIDIATAQFARAAAAEDAARILRDQWIVERKDLASKKTALEAAVIRETRQAWCVDLTEDASGYVATIEVPGENQAVLIAPGGRQPTASDGQLAARELMSPEQAFWNAAVLPGWQKWKPTYRKGTITGLDVDANRANVTLDTATSSANSLQVNQASTLSGVPVAYMECDASAFVVGDRVVVAFDGQDWRSPKVIGFVDHPKPCMWVCLGSFAATGLTVECMRPGVIDGLRAGATLTAWLNGSGPIDVPLAAGIGAAPGFHELHLPGGSGGTGLLIQALFYEGSTISDSDGPAQPHGGAVLYVEPPWPPPTDTSRNVLELVAKVGGVKQLHVAFTDTGWGGTPTFGTAKIKGCPIRLATSHPDLDVMVDRLEYTFIGS